MQLSLNWLKDFVEIPRNITPEKLGQLLSLHTVEVEKVEMQADKYKNVVVGEILEIKPHPKADRLRLAKIDAGIKKLEVVCGASNIEVGQLVPVALVGATLPNGVKIESAEIRGVKSNGMLCAQDELGLGSDHAGIMILEKAKVGQKFAEYLKMDDVIFEVDNKSITHRADLWSHYGMARDISAFLNSKFKPLVISNEAQRSEKSLKSGKSALKGFLAKARNDNFKTCFVKVKVEDFKLCPRYMAIGLEGIKIAPSPKWLAERLLAVGMRPINNIVDATNYVMLELGQPLHAFDKNFIDKIVVRRAKPGEVIETLDGQSRKLEPDMLVIANAEKAVAVAGIMGGANSEINLNTNSIIIEAANFNFDSVRKTAQTLALRTEASIRFEKGLDPNLAEQGIARAVELILKICPSARVASRLVDEKKFKLAEGPIDFDLAWLNQRIGQDFSAKQVRQVLEKLGFGISENSGKFSVIIPTWRAVRDISIAEDIVEEVARIYGYNNIKANLPKVEMAEPRLNQEKVLERKIKNILSLGARLTEVYNYSFVKIEGSGSLKLVNPLSEDLKYLRITLMHGLVENVKTNQAREEKIALYEIGSIFLDKPGENNLPFQEKRIGLALATNDESNLLRELKGIITYLLNSLNLEVAFDVVETRTGIFVNGKLIGKAYRLDNDYAGSLGLKKSVAMAEISFNDLYELVKNQPVKVYQELSKYPPATRDLAFVVDEKILYNEIKDVMEKYSDLIKLIELFDVYSGGKLGAGKKNMAFHVIYQANRTLTSEEVDELQQGLVKKLEKKLGAKIRNF